MHNPQQGEQGHLATVTSIHIQQSDAVNQIDKRVQA
jgi:hypothetical protein